MLPLETVKKSVWPAMFLRLLFFFVCCLAFNWIVILIEQKSFGGAYGFFYWHRDYFLKSYFLILLLYGIFLFFGSFKLATLLTGGFCYLFSMINYFKIQYRGEPLLPWDIYAVSEAGQVVGTLDLHFTAVNWFALGVVLFFVVLSFFLPGGKMLPFPKRMVLGIGVSLCTSFYMAGYVNKNYIHSNEWPDTWFRVEYNKKHGLLNSFLYNFRYLSIEEPEGYSKETMQNIAESFNHVSGAFGSVEEERTPNIIFIMSESFWDAEALDSLTFEEELLPTIRMLQENGISGEVLSPKFGGGTSNVEFEALTGFSNDSLPDGCIPYQQYIKKPFFSIAQFLKQKGYDTLAIHSDAEKNWNRYQAYPNMGFDDFISSEDFEDPEMLRGRISDFAVADRIISEYEAHEKVSDAPWFNFTVTVQNHTGYSSDNFTQEEKVKFISSTPLSEDVYGQLSDYVTGIHASDKALGELITYFETVEEPTILIFFGDHRTNLGSSEYQVFYETGYITQEMEKNEKTILTHTTPLVAWSNYELEQKELGLLAPYQILPAVFSSFDLEKPEFFQFLDKMRTVSTGFHLGILLDENGEPVLEATPEQKQYYETYHMIQYDYVIGKRYGEEALFPEMVEK